MKKIWIFLSIIGSIFTLLLSIFLFSLKEEYELIYLNHTPSTMLTFRNVNSNDSNREILAKLEKYSKENNINIYRQISNISELSQYNQDIYTCISNEDLFKKTFHIKSKKIDLSELDNSDMDQFTNSTIKFSPFLESEKEGIEGFYQFQAYQLDEEKLFSFLNSLNITYEKTKKLSLYDILDYVENQHAIKPLIYSLFFFLLTFVFVSLYEIFNRFKEIAILKMIGNKKRNIISRLLKEKLILLGFILVFYILSSLIFCLVVKKAARLADFLLFSLLSLLLYFLIILCLYLLLLLFIGIVDIPSMVKGKKNVKAIKPFHALAIIIFTVVMVFFFTNFRQEYKKLQESRDTIDLFQALKGYVSTNLSIANDKQVNYEEIGAKLKKFTLENYDRVVFYRPSTFFTPGYDELKLIAEEEPYILINENYLDDFFPLSISKEQISKDSNTITFLIPESLQGQEREIAKLAEILEINKKNLDNLQDAVSPFATEILPYKNQEIPIYADSFKLYRFLNFNAPIFMVITKENISSFGEAANQSFLAWYSSGSILLSEKQGRRINQLLIKEDLDRNIRNTVDIYLKLNKELQEIYNEILIYICSLLTLLIVYYNLIVFSTLSYLEEQKQAIFCRKIVGQSFFGLHRDYFLNMLIIVSMGSLLSYFIASAELTSTIIIIVIASLLIYLSLIIPTTLKKENK